MGGAEKTFKLEEKKKNQSAQMRFYRILINVTCGGKDVQKKANKSN